MADDLAPPPTPGPREADLQDGDDAAVYGHAPDTSEFQVIIERKRRNDFVRRQELEFLRRVRRDGLNAAQARSLKGENDFQDSSDTEEQVLLPAEPAVLAKIDDIERAMAEKATQERRVNRPPGSADTKPNVNAVGLERAKPDSQLDRAAMAFAAGDFDACESGLRRLIKIGAPRSDHLGTWHALFDLYRALGQRQRFDALALEFVQRLATGAPDWVTIPRLAQEVGAGLGPGLHLPGEQTYVGMVGHSLYDPNANSQFAITTVPSEKSDALIVTIELAGQLLGDISGMMARADLAVLKAEEIRISLARVIRVDLIAAGELLQWVISKRGYGCEISLTDAHRLTALFLCAMGVDDQAPIYLRPL